MNTVKPPFKYGSPSHAALKYASMKKNSVVTVEGVLSVFSHRFTKPSRVQRSYEMLTKYGMVANVGDGWRITPKGVVTLSAMASPYRGDEGFTRK
jgi:hypothetical protein